MVVGHKVLTPIPFPVSKRSIVLNFVLVFWASVGHGIFTPPAPVPEVLGSTVFRRQCKFRNMRKPIARDIEKLRNPPVGMRRFYSNDIEKRQKTCLECDSLMKITSNNLEKITECEDLMKRMSKIVKMD